MGFICSPTLPPSPELMCTETPSIGHAGDGPNAVARYQSPAGTPTAAGNGTPPPGNTNVTSTAETPAPGKTIRNGPIAPSSPRGPMLGAPVGGPNGLFARTSSVTVSGVAAA